MQRLMEFPIYQQNGGNFDDQFVIQLVKNYRSVPQLLTVPNKLFYGQKLEAQVKSSKTWHSIFGSKDCPLIFYSVDSEHKRYVPTYISVGRL